MKARVLVPIGAAVAVIVTVWLSLGAGRTGVVVVTALFAVLVLSLIPERSLPAIALVVWVLVPRRFTAALLNVDIVYPLMLILVVWAIRAMMRRRGELRARDEARTWLTVLFLALTVWLLFVTVIGRAWGESLTWVGAVVILFMAPTLLADRATSRVLVNTWLVMAGLVGAYAIIEFALSANIIYTPLYEALGESDIQRWSVYRSHATLGHPLYASLFLSAGLALALGRFLEGPRKIHLVVAALALGGVITTVSRSGLAAAAVASAAVLLIGVVRSRRVSSILRFGMVLAVAAALGWAFQSGAFAERTLSSEASSSSEAREWAIMLSFEAARQSGWVGAGPGTSADTVRALDSYQILVESGYLQLLVSIGVAGALLFIVILLLSGVAGLVRQRYAGLGALVAVAVSIAGFNGLESNPSMIILLGVAGAMIWSTDPLARELPNSVRKSEEARGHAG